MFTRTKVTVPFLFKRLLTTATAPQQASRSSLRSSSSSSFPKLKKFTIYTTATLTLLYAFDKTFNESALIRTSRAFYNLALIGLDYKLHFNESHNISDLHERNAQRLISVLMENKGLYVKLGQNLANQSAIFPPAYQRAFQQLYDSAGVDSFEKVERILIEELGHDWREKFQSIDEVPMASASIGQVHKGKLMTGEQVAVKIQHHYIAKQIEADFFTFGIFAQLYEWAFEIPVVFMHRYICDHMREEADFTIELNNLQRSKKLIQSDPLLKDKIYVPEVYEDLCTKRVLTAEWCDGESLVDHEKLSQSKEYNCKQIMNDYLTLFSKMIFEWGFVHSDPHPGNLLVRLNPLTQKQELVLLDHGLYITMRESIRREYCLLWKALFSLDEPTIRQIAQSWGIGSDQSDMFASLALLKPYHRTGDKLAKLSKFERESLLADRFKSFFSDTDKFPLELIFLGRTMRIVQGVNQRFGARVNRINIFTNTAVHSYYLNSAGKDVVVPWKIKLEQGFRYAVFVVIMTLSDLIFDIMKLSAQWFGTKNSEDLLESKMKEEMKKMGIEVPNDVDIFSG